ncbi:hypothetical protein ACHAXT_008677 [Thalassiosira profunda]
MAMPASPPSLTVCVTGANGYLASHIVRQLLQQGHAVHACVRDAENAASVQHLREIPSSSAGQLTLFSTGDMGDASLAGRYEQPLTGCDAVVHAATPLRPKLSGGEFDGMRDMVQPGMAGTQEMLEAILKCPSVKCLVLTSSMSAAAPRPEPEVKDETHWSDDAAQLARGNYYGCVKTRQERLCREFVREQKEKGTLPRDFRFAAICPTMILGPPVGAEKDGYLYTPAGTMGSLHKWMTGGRPSAPNDSMSFIDVQDCAAMHIAAIENGDAEGRYFSPLLQCRPCNLPSLALRGTLNESMEPVEEDAYAEAIQRTIFYIAIAAAFGAFLWMNDPSEGEEFFAGYILEKSLSVDNLFVFLLLFDYFKVPAPYQERILTWGIYGSVVMRSIMIGLGAAALQNAHEILLVFAAILIYSAGQVLFDVEDEKEEDLSANPVIKLSRNLFPSTDSYDGDRFFTFEDGVKKATPLFICMVAVELSDVVFAVDSIPAVFGVTENPLIVFSSNMFAILGLRSLYPILSKAATDLKYLEPAVAVILAFIGGKMIGEYFGYGISTEVALAVIVSLLASGVALSLREKQDGNE